MLAIVETMLKPSPPLILFYGRHPAPVEVGNVSYHIHYLQQVLYIPGGFLAGFQPSNSEKPIFGDTSAPASSTHAEAVWDFCIKNWIHVWYIYCNYIWLIFMVNVGRYTIHLAKLLYSTSVDFLEIMGFCLPKSYLLGFLVVWGRYNLTRLDRNRSHDDDWEGFFHHPMVNSSLVSDQSVKTPIDCRKFKMGPASYQWSYNPYK